MQRHCCPIENFYSVFAFYITLYLLFGAACDDHWAEKSNERCHSKRHNLMRMGVTRDHIDQQNDPVFLERPIVTNKITEQNLKEICC